MEREQPRHSAADRSGSSHFIGPWQIQNTAGGPGLHRPDGAAHPVAWDPDWSDETDIPGAGESRRVVVLGESTARGWPFESVLSPTSVLARNLENHGAFQCIDLAKVGADGEILLNVAAGLHRLRPDVVVSFAGNNWMMPPATDGSTGFAPHLAAALRRGGYPALKEAVNAHAITAVHAYLAALLRLHRTSSARIVIVVTEFNLVGFVPPADVQTPAMPRRHLAEWHRLRAEAEAALQVHDVDTVTACATSMIDLDGGCSPVPGRLNGIAAMASGDGAAARAALEQSRDSVVGLMLRYTPRTTRAVQDLLLDFAAEHRFACVDLRTVLADPRMPDVPDPGCFHDYCHLSGDGIERAVAAITDAVLGHEDGSTPPGDGLPPAAQAFGHARAAAHLAFQAQPADAVAEHITAAEIGDPRLTSVLGDLRDLLGAASPGWTAPAMERLLANPQVGPFVGAMTGRPALAPELWILRDCLEDRLGQTPHRTTLDEHDLLAVPEPDGHALPNWTAPWAHHVSCSSESVLTFAADTPKPFTLRLELRARWVLHDDVVRMRCNGTPLQGVAVGGDWRTVQVDIPRHAIRTGVNRISIGWPLPDQDVARAIDDDARALERREFPMVLPIFGELYEARLLSADV